jgi:hypothetical protein
MPKEISDIKNVSLPCSMRGEKDWNRNTDPEQFIEICRRKDASCTFSQSVEVPYQDSGYELEWSRREREEDRANGD